MLLSKQENQIRLIELDESYREKTIELVHQFFKKINSFSLDGIFKIKPKAAMKMVDIFLKLRESKKVLIAGIVNSQNDLLSILIGRVEERPYLEEERILYIEIAATKNGQFKKGYMKMLVSYTEDWARKKGIHIIELRTLLENKEAIEFWNNRKYNQFYIRFRKKV
jgi:hypothetical protein